ncbi:MAG: 2,3-butanediol dehydrogenase [Chloroflexota bacterium]
MRALRWHAPGDVRLDETPEPAPGKGEVKIRVKWCGICGSDVHEYESGPLLVPTLKPHPRTGKQAPVTLGHEFSGEVVEVGAGLNDIRVGERVAVRPTMPCYSCYWCQRGRHIQCTSLATIGYAWDGAFAPYAVVPGDTVYRLPDELDYAAAALCEPLAVALHGCKRGGLEPGDRVAVIGAGPIGLLTLQAAKAAGAGQVFVVEPLASRREIALGLGGTEVLDPGKVDVSKEISRLTDKLRVDIVFECAGPPVAMLTALRVCGRGGKIVEMGQMLESCSFPFQALWLREQMIIASQGYVDEFPLAIALLADGQIQVEPLITARIKLDDIIESGFKELTGGKRLEHLKVLVSPK